MRIFIKYTPINSRVKIEKQISIKKFCVNL